MCIRLDQKRRVLAWMVLALLLFQVAMANPLEGAGQHGHLQKGGYGPTGTLLPEDVDGNCNVDVADIVQVARYWNQPLGSTNQAFDLNRDGVIDVIDIQQVASRWGIQCEGPAWLVHLNGYRALALLPPVLENPVWSEGARLHSRYMVKNDEITHSEDPQNPWYTPEGAAAGANGNVMVSSTVRRTDEQAVDLWMAGPFHALGIIDPRLTETGFGSYREQVGRWRMGATLDVLRGRGDLPAGLRFPILFPADGQTIPLWQYRGGEFPDPLTSCPGYAAPTGSPILMQFEQTPQVTAYSLTKAGVALAVCVYNEQTYNHPDPNVQQLGRNILTGRHAVVVIPREPLQAGVYTVSVTVNETPYTWSFHVDEAVAGTTAVEGAGVDPMVDPP